MVHCEELFLFFSLCRISGSCIWWSCYPKYFIFKLVSHWSKVLIVNVYYDWMTYSLYFPLIFFIRLLQWLYTETLHVTSRLSVSGRTWCCLILETVSTQYRLFKMKMRTPWLLMMAQSIFLCHLVSWQGMFSLWKFYVFLLFVLEQARYYNEHLVK